MSIKFRFGAEPFRLTEQVIRQFEQDATSGKIDKDNLEKLMNILKKLRDMPRPIFPELLLKRTYGE